MASTYDRVLASFSFSDRSGLTVTRTTPEGELTTIPATSIITLLPGNFPHEYNFVHTADTSLLTTSITYPPPELLETYEYKGFPDHLEPSKSETTILISTTSGGHAAENYYNTYLQPLLELIKLSPEVIYTTSATSITDTAKSLASKTKPQTLFLLSGDTAIHELINVLPHESSNLTLALFPCGTGNALVSSLHTVRAINPLAAALFGSPHPLPLFKATFSPHAKWRDDGSSAITVTGAVVLSWGFHASLVADADALRGKGVGVERFVTAAKQNLDPTHGYSGRVMAMTEDKEWVEIEEGQEKFYVLSTLASNLEPAFMISPDSQPGENAMWALTFGKLSAAEVMEIMQGAREGGKHVTDPRVRYRKIYGIKIQVDEEDERWRRVCVDGRIAVLERGGWITASMVESEGAVKTIWKEA